MPRDYSQLKVNPESHVRGDEIPDLTLDNAAELITDCDYLMISVRELPARRFYDTEHVESRGRSTGIGSKDVTSNRHDTIFTEFLKRFGHLTPTDEPSSATTVGMRHYKLIPNETTTFNDIQQFITDLVPLWRFISVSFCWSNHQHPKASTIIYQTEDNMPPHPQTEAFKEETQSRYKSDDEKRVLRNQYLADHKEYVEENTDPRFTFGVQYVINGDYGAGGADIYMYVCNNLATDILFDIESHTDTLRFPSEYDTVNDISDYLTVTTDYPENMDITHIQGRSQTVTEENTPQPVITPLPKDYESIVLD